MIILKVDGFMGNKNAVRTSKAGNNYQTFSVSSSNGKKNQDGTWDNSIPATWINVFCNNPEHLTVMEGIEKKDRVLVEGKAKIYMTDSNRLQVDLYADNISLKEKRATPQEQTNYYNDAPLQSEPYQPIDSATSEEVMPF